jgi:hypothetical protein
LSINHQPQVSKLILEKANSDVIKSISNAALNAYKGKVKLSPSSRKRFAAKRKQFEKLIDRKVPIAAKRKLLLNQRGGAFGLIPLLLSSVIGTIGSAFLNRN